MSKRGTGRVYRRGNVWWIQYGHRGEDIRESSRSQKKKDAVALLRKRMAEMGSGRLVGPQAERVLFEDLAQGIRDDYRINRRRSTGSMNAALRHLEAAFGMMRALDMTTERVRSYIVDRQDEGAANATIQIELAILKRAFNLAVQAGTLPHRPHIPSIQIDNARQGFLSAADVDRICGNLPDELAPLVRFAFLTGWRAGEVFPLQWSQVDFTVGVVRLEPGTTKNRHGRSFPFRALPALAELLEGQQQHTRQIERETNQVIPWVFHRSGKQIKSIRIAWKKACVAAGVPDALFHDLRRSAVVNLERAGVPRSVSMKLTGHLTESIFRRYAIVDSAALAEGVEKLARLDTDSSGKGRKIVPLKQDIGS